MVKYFLAFGLTFVSCLSFSQDGLIKSTWVSAPVKIDGNAREWKRPLRFYDLNTKLSFAFTNDDKNLYLCFQTPDEMNELKIMHAGMEVSLITRGKHKASINFPLEKKGESALPQTEFSINQNFDRMSRRSSFLAQNTMMEVNGFTTRNGMIPINDSSGINAAINWDSTNKFTYEISIPFKELFGINFTTADILKDISLDIEINAVKKKNFSARDFRGSRMGGRMRGGSGIHNDKDGNEEENSEPTFEDKMAIFQKSKMKQKFILSQSNDSN